MGGIRVYRPTVTEGYEWVQPVDEADFDAVYQLNGKSLASRWAPIRMHVINTDEHGKAGRHADLPWLGGHALALRERAFESIGYLLADFGELLELNLDDNNGERLWLFNVRNRLDVLDEEQSEIVRFPSSGRIMYVKQHVFHPEEITSEQIFLQPGVRSVFLTGGIVDAIQSAALTGTRFELLWEESAASPEQSSEEAEA